MDKLTEEVGVAERKDGASLSITVLIVDDSAYMPMIKQMLTTDPEIDVVGVAVNGLDALKKVQVYNPK